MKAHRYLSQVRSQGWRSPTTRPFCPDGHAIAEPIGKAQVDEAFAAMAAASEARVGKEFADPDIGDTVITSFDTPALGTSSFTSGYRPVTPPTSEPVHDNPDQQVEAVDTLS